MITWIRFDIQKGVMFWHRMLLESLRKIVISIIRQHWSSRRQNGFVKWSNSRGGFVSGLGRITEKKKEFGGCIENWDGARILTGPSIMDGIVVGIKDPAEMFEVQRALQQQGRRGLP